MKRTKNSCYTYFAIKGNFNPDVISKKLQLTPNSNVKVFDCNDCGNTFSPFKGTIFEKSSKQENNNTIMTDEFRGYDPLTKNNLVHLRVDHTKAFSDNNGTHTNNIESFWATLKRGIYGIYHHISIEYMQRYVDEFCFRYNNRENDMFNLVLKQSIL